MSAWPDTTEACKNCTGTAYSYGARGHCVRCYRLIRHIEEVKAWDRNNRATLKRLPKDGMYDPAVETYHTTGRFLTDSFTDEEFEICRDEHIRQLNCRLALLRRREEIRRYEISVSALDVEGKFAELLKLIRPKARYPQNASHINKHFNGQERRVIYALIEEVIEQAPWRGVSWSPVSKRIREHRNSRGNRR